VYKLGAVYLQLTKLLRIEDHPSLTRPIDPSLYIHRFVEKLEVPHATVRGSDGKALRVGLPRCWCGCICTSTPTHVRGGAADSRRAVG
jgi:hypothetical protein